MEQSKPGRYRRYEKYELGVASWQGLVPEHWQPTRFKNVLLDKKKTSNPSLAAGSISFGRVVFKDSENLAQETKDSYQEVLAGEYLVNPLNLNYDLLSLRTAMSEIDVVVSTGYIVLKSSGKLKPGGFKPKVQHLPPIKVRRCHHLVRPRPINNFSLKIASPLLA